jgi:hypothetical protein
VNDWNGFRIGCFRPEDDGLLDSHKIPFVQNGNLEHGPTLMCINQQKKTESNEKLDILLGFTRILRSQPVNRVARLQPFPPNLRDTTHAVVSNSMIL